MKAIFHLGVLRKTNGKSEKQTEFWTLRRVVRVASHLNVRLTAMRVTCYNSAKPLETSKSVRKRPEIHSFSAGRTSRNGPYNGDNANFSA